MGRDITKLHPRLQTLAKKLKTECAKQGLKIEFSECLRTVAEQDALYAKGRTAPGSIVTNAKGSSYSSMHQWGVAIDFYRNDGKGAYYDNDGFFKKVGAIGKKLGLEWGGDFKSIKDNPHFQLPDWGSTTSKLKATYGTPAKFMKIWPSTSSTTTTNKTTSTRKYAVATVKLGNKSSNVKLLQQNLNTVMKSGLKADGNCGTKTVNAIKAFQKKYKLTVDGVYGAKCQAKMKTLIK